MTGDQAYENLTKKPEIMKGVHNMCDVAQKLIKEGIEEANIKAIQKMLKNPKYTNEDIKEIYEITDEEIENIRDEMLVK